MDILDIISSVVPELTDEQAGQLIKAVCLLRDGEDYEVTDITVKVAVKAVEAALVDNYRNERAMEEAIEAQENRPRRGAPKGSRNNPNGRGGKRTNSDLISSELVPELVPISSGISSSEGKKVLSDSIDNPIVVVDYQMVDKLIPHKEEDKGISSPISSPISSELVLISSLEKKKELPPIEDSIDNLFPLDKEKEEEKEISPSSSPNKKNQPAPAEEEKELREEKKKKKPDPYNYDLSFIDPDDKLLPIFKDWLQYKKERHESYKPMGLKAAFTKLKNYSKGDPDVARKIITDAMGNNYQGFFPARADTARQGDDRVDTRFVNTRYDVNDYTFDD